MVPGKSDHKLPWYYQPISVILLLFALGPFALPWLLKSPAFSIPLKAVLTLITLIVTFWMLMIAVNTARAIWDHFKALQFV